MAIVVGIGFGAGFSCVHGQSAGSTSTGPPPALQAVVADAASRAGADQRTVQVVRIERREWSDTGLGCPRPGAIYAQVMTPGWLIEVQSGRRVLEYHTDSGESFVLCVER